MSLLQQTLSRFQASTELIGIYDDETRTDVFHLGWLVDLTVDHYALVSIGLQGEFDSAIVGSLENIVRISHGTDYINQVAPLASFSDALHNLDIKEISASIDDTIDKAARSNTLVTFIDRNRELTRGYPQEQDKDWVSLAVVAKNGARDGFETIRKMDLIRIELYDKTCRQISQNLEKFRNQTP